MELTFFGIGNQTKTNESLKFEAFSEYIPIISFSLNLN